MRKFLSNIAWFLIAFLLVINSLLYGGAYFLKSKKPFEIPEGATLLIIGNSQPEAAFNDALIENSYNFSKEAEPYFYTYIKLRGLLEKQHSVERVFIQVSPWEFTSERDNWVWGKSNLQSMYWKFFLYFSAEEYGLLFSKSWDNLLNVHLFQSLTRLYKRVVLADPAYVRADYGGYVAWPETDLPLGQKIPEAEVIAYDESNIHFIYLDKIVTFLQERGVKVYFIQTPLHSSVQKIYSSDAMLQQFPTDLRQIPYFNFSTYPMPDAYFSDEYHLNSQGSEIFSRWLNEKLSNELWNFEFE